MRKLVLVLLAVAVVLTLCISPAFAAQKDNPANDKTGNLYLYAKDASWNIVWGGAWGKLNYNPAGKAVFNGHGLVAGTGYSLIVYNDPWPGAPITIIGTGVADTEGNVHIAGSLPSGTAYKVWLVLSSDVSISGMTAWHPGEYLFEHNLITVP